jgi:hypothetical protein
MDLQQRGRMQKMLESARRSLDRIGREAETLRGTLRPVDPEGRIADKFHDACCEAVQDLGERVGA